MAVDAFKEWANILKQVKADMEQIVLDEVIKNKHFVLDLVTEEQLMQGIKADGSLIMPQYSPLTVSIKRSKGQESGHVTLKDTGDYHEGHDLKRMEDGFEVINRDEKTLKLTTKYTSKILGLTDDNIDEMNRFILDDVIENVRDRLDL